MQEVFGVLMDSNILFTKAQISENFNMIQKIFNLDALSERFAATKIGQFVITKTERALWVVEKTAAWGLPHKHRKDTPERPLSWIPFFTLIILLRMSRATLTLMAILLNKSAVTPQKTVLFIQSKRRELRALKRRGIMEMTASEQEPSSAKEGEKNSAASNNVQKKRMPRPRGIIYDPSWSEVLKQHEDQESDPDDSDYLFGTEETSTESDELSENDNVPENVENLQNDVELEARDHTKSEAKDNEETISEKEDAREESNDPPSTNNPEHNHVSSLQVKLSENKPKESPISSETLMPNSAIDPEVLVEKLTNELQKIENAQNAYSTSYDGDSSMDPSLLVAGINLLLAHNGGNVEDLNKHVNEIFKAKASPNVENTLENHHPVKIVGARESEILIREEKAASSAGVNHRTQNINKSDKNLPSSNINLKRPKAPVPRRAK